MGTVFPNVLTLSLNDLEKKEMVAERAQIFDVVHALIASDTRLIEVTFQSAPHERVQESVELRGIAEDSVMCRKPKRKDWSAAYKYLRETQIHQLIFSSIKDQRIKVLNQKINDLTRMNDDLRQSNVDQKREFTKKNNELNEENSVLKQ